jgi:hypothetical protein
MKRAIAALVLVCAIIAGTAHACSAAERKLLIVVVDKVTWHDLLAEDVRAPTLRRLAEEGVPGMMCVRAARGFAGEYATLGAGSRAASKMDPASRTSVEANAFQATERVDNAAAAREFEVRTGWKVGGNAIAHLGIGELVRQNEEALYPLKLGLLGGTLRRAGIRVACVGNADTADARHREAVAIAMDEQGLVPLGDVSADLLRPDWGAPYGLTFDPARVTEAVRRLSRSADVIVLDPGETARVYESAQWMTPAVASVARRRAIEKTDRLLSALLPALPRGQWSLLVITPSLRSPERDEAFAALAPVIWWGEPMGEEKAPGGGAGRPTPRLLDSSSALLLTSPSTRRPGIVVNTDVAPTALSYFGLPIPKEMVGRPFGFAQGRPFAGEKTQGKTLYRLRADLARHDAVDRVRSQLSRAVPVLGAIALWLAALLMLIGQSVPGGLRAIARGLLLVVLSAPAAMLLVALRALEPPAIIGAVAGLSCGIALLSGWLTRWRSGYALVSFVLMGLLAYDVLRGQQMLYWSALSYSPAAGARFYGIGNEYGGALLGAALMAAAWLLPPRDRGSTTGRALVGLLLLALAVLVGLPSYGANLGMSLALGVGAAVFCLYLWRQRVGWPEVVSAALAAMVIVGGAIALDYFRHGSETSHIGRWIASVQREGWQAAFAVGVRKLGMNLMLLRISVWTDAAVAALAVLVVAVAARPAAMLAALREREWLTPAIISGVAGAAAACLLNDSGIVAASIALICLAGSLAYVALEERREQG